MAQNQTSLIVYKDSKTREIVKSLNKRGAIAKYKLNSDDIECITDMIRVYSTDVNAVGKMLDKEYSLNEISSILEVREELMDFSIKDNDGRANMSLTQIIGLHETFGDGGKFCSESVLHIVNQLKDSKLYEHCKYLSTAAKVAIEIHKSDSLSLDIICNGRYNNPYIRNTLSEASE